MTPEWMRHGACLTAQALPWTTDEADAPSVLVELMQGTCAVCPVRLACAAYADREGITGGWWSGEDRDPENALRWEALAWVPVRARDGRDLGAQAVLPLALDGAA